MRHVSVLWLVLPGVGWVVLAVLSEDPGLKWAYATAAVLSAVGMFLLWWDRRKREARNSPDADEHHPSKH